MIEALRDRSVHVWSAPLDAPAQVVDAHRELLSPDELERAARFHFARDRDRFVVGRGTLRRLLAKYVDANAESFLFTYGPYGKPALVRGEDLTFNVSHSGGRALYAFARRTEIGIDIEELAPRVVDLAVARQFFAAREVEELFALAPALRPVAFLTCWTRKEAYIKARGEGLSLPLQDFDVTFTPSAAPCLRRTAWSATEPGEWLIEDLSHVSPSGYVAALAARARELEVIARDYPSGAVHAEPGALAVAAARAQVAAQA